MLWHCQLSMVRKGCREAVLNISIKTSRHNAPWTMQSPETKRTLQSHYPPGGENPLSSHQKEVNMYIVGCFDSHFAIDSNWPVREKEQVLIRMHPGSSEICLISRYGLTMSWVAWVGVGKLLEKERGFFSILHNVGSMTKNLCKSCCTKLVPRV